MPPSAVSLGDQAVEFAARAGLFLDPWQQDVLRSSLGFNQGGKFASRNVGLLVPRQNGKGAVLEARELFGMFVLNEPLIIHSAHKFDTSQEHFGRMQILIDGNPDLKRHVANVYTANGKESITLKNGSRLKFKARTISGSGRGFSCDCLVLDEAMLLPSQALAAMGPAQNARKNPQTWFTSSAGLPDSDALWRLVKRGRAGGDRLAYFEWGCPVGIDPTDRANWVASNPALGYRLTAEEFEDGLWKQTPDDFAREYLGIWDDAAENAMYRSWAAQVDRSNDAPGPATYALEVAEDRSWACVAAAMPVSAGLHVEVGAYKSGTAWVVPYLTDLASRKRVKIVVQPSSPAGSFVSELEARRMTVEKASLDNYRAACGQFFDSVTDSRDIWHAEQQSLDISVREATQKPSGDAWVWDRRNPTTDISPLVAATLAAWGARQKPKTGRFITF